MTITAVTTNTRPQRVFLLDRFKPAVWWRPINRYHGFHALAKGRFFQIQISCYPLPSGLFRDNLQHWLADFASVTAVNSIAIHVLIR